MRPLGLVNATAPFVIVQSPDNAHWLTATARAPRKRAVCHVARRSMTKNSRYGHNQRSFPATSSRSRRRGLKARRIDGHETLPDAAVSCLDQELLDDAFGLFVTSLAELVVPNAPLRIDDVERRPIMVAEGLSDREVVVDGDRSRRRGERPSRANWPATKGGALSHVVAPEKDGIMPSTANSART